MHLVGKDSIIVGIDVHKYAHQAVALGCFGEELGTLEFSNDEIQKCISWLGNLGKKEHIIVGLEDMNGLGIHLTRELQTAGFSLRYSPGVYTERERKHSTQQDKNDYLDAKRVGKVILTKSEETLPATHIVPQEVMRTLDLLLQERAELVKEQTALKNQLHGLLHQYYANGYKQSVKNIFTQKAVHLMAGLVDGTGAAVDGSVVEADASCERRLDGDCLPEAWSNRESQAQPVRAYLDALDAASAPARDEPKQAAPKHLSETDPQAA